MSGERAQPDAPSRSWIATVLRKAFHHTAIYGVSVSLLPLTSFVLLPVYTRSLGAETFGLLALFMVTSGILSFLYDFGMINALFRRYFEHPAEADQHRKRVLSTAWSFMALHALFWTLVLAGCVAWVPAIGRSAALSKVAWLMLVSTLVNSWTDVPMAVLRIRGRVATFAAVSCVRSAALVLMTWWLVMGAQRGLAGVFEASLLVGVGSLGLLVALTAREYAIGMSWRELKAMLAFGVPFFPVLFFTWIIDFSDRYFLGTLSTLQEVGVYTVGYKIGQVVLLAVKAFMVAWIPLMFSIAREARAPEAFAKVFRYYVFGLGLLSLTLLLWSPELVRLVAAPGYERSAQIVPLVVIAYACYGLYSFMLSGLLVAKDVWVQPLTLAACALLNAFLNWWWIPLMGMWGAAWSTLLSYGIAATVTWAAAQRRYRIPIDGIALYGTAVLTLGGWALASGLHLPQTGKVLILLAYGLVFVALGWLTPAGWQELRAVVGARRRTVVAADMALAEK